MTDLLDMTLGVSKRQSTWRFDLVDQNLQREGNLEVDRKSPPAMSVDVSRAAKRTLTNVALVPGAINDIDVIKQRLQVTMILDDGSEWPQGVFLFSDASRIVLSAGVDYDIGAVSFVDQCLIVDQAVEKAISFGPGKQITLAMTELLAELPISFNVESSGAVVSAGAEAIAWPAGTSRLKIINELAAMVGYHELFFDNFGIGQLHPMPDPNATPPDDVISYPVGIRTYRATITRSTNILELPNRFLVVNNGATVAPVYGVFEVSADAPHSVTNRGFAITEVEQIQGIDTITDANAAAEALSRRWRYPYETVDFSGPPDPRHDHYTTVDFEGVRFLELSWRMALSEGVGMAHNIRRTYTGS